MLAQSTGSITLAVLCYFAAAHAASLAAASLPPIYSADFSTPLDLAFEADLLDAAGKHRVRVPTAGWVLESVDNSSVAYTADDHLYMENNGSHMVLWANRPFPAEGEVRFGVMPADTSVGLNIVFYATMPLCNVTKYADATTIFDVSLPPRGGNYPAYHGGKGGRGSILGYSNSYWRAGNGTQSCERNPTDGKCTATLRKNPGFVIAAQGDDLVLGRAPKNGKAFEIVLRRVSAKTTITVDGVTSLEWTDDGIMSAPFKGGYVGLRQMLTTRIGVYTHFDVHALEAPKAAPELESKRKPHLTLALAAAATATAAATQPTNSTLAERKHAVLQQHISDPWPQVKDAEPSTWGTINLAFARLALHGPANATLAAEVSAEVAAWAHMPQFTPWDNYTVKCKTGHSPLQGLGELPLLARMALLPRTRELLSPAALSALEGMFLAWLSPRSKVAWAASPDSWLVTDGSENLDATRKAGLYLSALALNVTSPSTRLGLDNKTVAEHAAAWETHWTTYFQHRAVEGIGVELGSPTYGKYSLQNYLNLADLAGTAALRKLAGNFLQLWFADAAQAFLPSTGVRGGAHNRVYRDGAFFIPSADDFRGFSWLYGWWHAGGTVGQADVTNAIKAPQLTLFATSEWHPLPIVTAIAKAFDQPAFLYVSRRLGDEAPCSQPLGPVVPQGTLRYPTVNCTKLPCKPCVVCRGILALGGDQCNEAVVPTTVVKQEYIGAQRHFTLGAISLRQDAAAPNAGNVGSSVTSTGSPGYVERYGAGVGQNHQIGAFFGGSSTPETRLIFGDSGSVNCTDVAAFQRHTYASITSRLVAGAVAVARPATAKINGCVSSHRDAGSSCHNNDFPLFAFVSAALYSTRTTAGDWDCFEAAGGESYACVGITGGQRLQPALTPCTGAAGLDWNGTLLTFNGSSSSSSIGVLQMGSAAEHGGSFQRFVAKMAAKKLADSTDAAGNLRYRSLHGEELVLGVGGVLPPGARYDDPQQTYMSPYISAPHQQKMDVTLSAPGHQAVTLSFDASRQEGSMNET